MTALKSYGTMEDSHVEWLGQVPVHWEVVMIKHHYAIQLGKMLQNTPISTHDIEISYIKAKHVQWFDVRITDTPRMWASQSEIEQYGIMPNDLLVCEGGEGGRCGILKQRVDRVIIQNALHRVRPKKENSNDFLQYVMSTISANGWFDALNDKATIAHFTKAKIGSLRIPLPPLSEQTSIVRFLDHADNRIQRLIRGKSQLFTFLEEQKQTVIQQAIIGQIDVRTGKPYMAYKDSGVECLGNVPEHWKALKLGQIGRFSKGFGGNKEDEIPKGIPCVRYGDLYTSHTNFIHASRSCVSKLKAKEYTPIRYGDILFATSGETIDEIGKSAVNLLTSDAVCGGDVILLRLRCSFDARFMGYATNCRPVITQKSTMGRGITVMHIYANHLKNVTIPLPPLAEQIAIARFLDHAITAIDTAISHAKREIDLLNEFRTRLVADVVTGKLDVREAALRLSDEAEPVDAVADSAESQRKEDTAVQVAS